MTPKITASIDFPFPHKLLLYLFQIIGRYETPDTVPIFTRPPCAGQQARREEGKCHSQSSDVFSNTLRICPVCTLKSPESCIAHQHVDTHRRDDDVEAESLTAPA